MKLSSQVKVNKAVALDLNGKTISYDSYFPLPSGLINVENGGDLTVYGNGSIVSDNNAYAAITVIGNNDFNSNAVKLTIENGTFQGKYYPISGNGTYHNTEITINGGTFSSTEGLCIYHPQDGTLTINGGSFEGQESAIEIRSGNLTINDGTFKATNTPAVSLPNGNGTTSDGVAIAVAQHTTKKAINVAINGGTFEGYSAFYESNPQNNSADDIAKVNLAITGGTFNAINGGTCAVFSKDKVGFITGGTFSSNPSEYVATGYEAISNENGYNVSAKTSVWDGTSSTENWKADDNGVYHITSAADFKAFADAVNSVESGCNSFSGKTVVLETNIDLDKHEWTPIGQTGAGQFAGKFEGNGLTIKNLNINNTDESSDCATGLFGWLNTATIKNLTIDNARVSGHHNVGVVAGYMENPSKIESGCTIENVHVSNATVSCTHVNDDANGDKCGGIVGYANNEEVILKNCTVTNSTISAVRDAGQVVGIAKQINVIDCSASNVEVTFNNTFTGDKSNTNIRNEVIGKVVA